MKQGVLDFDNILVNEDGDVYYKDKLIAKIVIEDQEEDDEQQ